MILLLPKNRTGVMVAGCLCLIVTFLLLLRERSDSVREPFEEAVLEILLSVILGVFFYLRWYGASRTRAFAGIFHLPPKQFCALAAAALSFAACFSLKYLSRFFPSCGKSRGKVSVVLFLLCISVLVITFASASSPLYPINDWVDPNIMLTVGKGMLKGMVPYRDLYEQKGPLILAVHALGALISSDSFLGIWIIEILICFFFLLIQFRILTVRTGRKPFVLIPVIALLTYISPAFVKGDSAEEMVMPLLSYAVYVGVRSVDRKKIPDVLEGFLIGVTSACVLWIKYSMLGFYIGWFLFFFIFAVKEKALGSLWRMMTGIISGVIVLSIPVFLYFAANHAVKDFLECYFYNNIRYYPALGSAEGPFRLLINLWNGLLLFIQTNPLILVFFVIGVIWNCLHHDRRSAAFQLLTFGMGFFFIFMNGTSFIYYTFIFACFWGLGLEWANSFALFSNRFHPENVFVSFFLCLGGILILSENIYMLRYEKQEYPQFRTAEIIRNSGIEDPSLLQYGLLDDGFNLTAGLIPRERFFCHFNLLLPELKTEQQRYIDEAIPDFVVTCHVPLPDTENYELIEELPGYYTADGDASQFFFYQKVSAGE